jgi:DNA-binding response OmpR family regulator
MRVLLIEDDSATAQSIELMLKSEGFNVYTTDLGEEGVDLGKLYDYDIILLDLNLPDMSGYEVLKSLRVSKVGTPILILSGLAGIEDKVKGLGFGADDYMTNLLRAFTLWSAAQRAMPSRLFSQASFSSISIRRQLKSVANAFT